MEGEGARPGERVYPHVCIRHCPQGSLHQASKEGVLGNCCPLQSARRIPHDIRHLHQGGRSKGCIAQVNPIKDLHARGSVR